MLPDLVAHADWGSVPRKRVVAVARQAAAGYEVVALTAAGDGDLVAALRRRYQPFQAVLGFDFPIGLPRAYARAAGVASFTEFLGQLGAPPWAEFAQVAARPGQISLRRPFYPARPGGTRRAHLSAGLGLTETELRRRCDGTDAETLFWTLGAGRPARRRCTAGRCYGWPEPMARTSRCGRSTGRCWPGPDSPSPRRYPREFYQYFGVPRGRWSKRRRADRLACMPALLAWAGDLGVRWDEAVRGRVSAGCSDGPAGEDEFDAIAGVLGMIAVVTGIIAPGVPAEDPDVTATEGWILGRAG